MTKLIAKNTYPYLPSDTVPTNMIMLSTYNNILMHRKYEYPTKFPISTIEVIE